ncbi:hypothetical protein [Candidatus Avelusimicrobium luingense]|uniref:hypothetical protein n=1 Tax=Candidatus Avelusimicrobium luingense TaxID=3416211 RepID=UPI003D1019F1
MEKEDLDLDVKPAGNKDLWLFLIVIDMVLLCVFGFFVYQRLSNSVFHTSGTQDGVAVEEEVVQEVAPESEVISVAAEPEIVTPVVVQEEAVVEIKPAPQPEIKPVETIVQEVITEEAPAEKKVSVTVTANAKSKYRRVTFRWFGEGKKVQIVSGFTMSKPQALTKKGDHWETTLSILPGTYKFLYIIDGVNQKDPYSPEKDGRSVVIID